MAKLSIFDIVERSNEVIAQPIDDDMVLVNLQTHEYYALHTSSLRIWQLMESQTSIEQIIATLDHEVDASKDVITTDVLEFLEQLLEERLISVVVKAQSVGER